MTEISGGAEFTYFRFLKISESPKITINTGHNTCPTSGIIPRFFKRKTTPIVINIIPEYTLPSFYLTVLNTTSVKLPVRNISSFDLAVS